MQPTEDMAGGTFPGGATHSDGRIHALYIGLIYNNLLGAVAQHAHLCLAQELAVAQRLDHLVHITMRAHLGAGPPQQATARQCRTWECGQHV